MTIARGGVDDCVARFVGIHCLVGPGLQQRTDSTEVPVARRGPQVVAIVHPEK